MNGAWPRAVAVLGAGVMGVQIAALVAASGRRVLLLDLPDEQGGARRAVEGIDKALRARPPAFYTADMAERIEVGTFADLSQLSGADWIVEAVVEDLQTKQQILARVDAEVEGEAVVSSNTSGLSIAALAAGRSESFTRRFMGIHFFNPPRYMKLVEAVPGAATDPNLVRQMANFLRNELGKGVVVARDTPNFIGNRLGVFAVLSMLHLMEREALTVAEVDALSGRLMGRPTSATLRLCDIIGLDTLMRVAGTAQQLLVDDPWRSHFAAPALLERMLDAGLLGAKAGGGFYRKDDRGILVLNPHTLEYEASTPAAMGALEGVGGSARERVLALWNDGGRWGNLARQHLREVLLYAAWHADQIAECPGDIDDAMRWGFNWELGPFALWNALGMESVAAGVEPLPPLVEEARASGRAHIASQPLSDERTGDDPSGLLRSDRALMANDEAFVCPLDDGLGALVFCGKMNALGRGVIDAVRWLERERPFTGLLLCGTEPNFSVGANLRDIAGFTQEELVQFLVDFQRAVESIRLAPFPVVAAVRGLCLGGGCEFSLAAHARVVAAEARIGLVEAGVGLLPSGGGIVHMARTAGAANLLPVFETLCQGHLCENAFEARARGFLSENDRVIFGEEALLARAIETLRAWVDSGQHAPADALVRIGGQEAHRALKTWVDERIEQGAMSAYDGVVGMHLARALTGGGGPARACSTEELLTLEREAFMALCASEETRQRIDHMLATGKRLKN